MIFENSKESRPFSIFIARLGLRLLRNKGTMWPCERMGIYSWGLGWQNYSTGNFFASIAGGLAGEIIRLAMDHHCAANHFIDGKTPA